MIAPAGVDRRLNDLVERPATPAASPASRSRRAGLARRRPRRSAGGGRGVLGLAARGPVRAATAGAGARRPRRSATGLRPAGSRARPGRGCRSRSGSRSCRSSAGSGAAGRCRRSSRPRCRRRCSPGRRSPIANALRRRRARPRQRVSHRSRLGSGATGLARVDASLLLGRRLGPRGRDARPGRPSSDRRSPRSVAGAVRAGRRRLAPAGRTLRSASGLGGPGGRGRGARRGWLGHGGAGLTPRSAGP